MYRLMTYIIQDPNYYVRYIDTRAHPVTMQGLLNLKELDSHGQVQNLLALSPGQHVVSTALKARFGNLISTNHLRQGWGSIITLASTAIISPMFKHMLEFVCSGDAFSYVPGRWWISSIRPFLVAQGSIVNNIRALCIGFANQMLLQIHTHNLQNKSMFWTSQALWDLFVHKKTCDTDMVSSDSMVNVCSSSYVHIGS